MDSGMITVVGEKDGVGGEGDIMMISTWNIRVVCRWCWEELANDCKDRQDATLNWRLRYIKCQVVIYGTGYRSTHKGVQSHEYSWIFDLADWSWRSGGLTRERPGYDKIRYTTSQKLL